MISFVWSGAHPFLAGAGGSENFTAGQIRELQRRGIKSRILTLGFGNKDGRDQFPDITFKALHSKEQLSLLSDIIVYVTYPLNVRTLHPAYTILHCPPASCGVNDPLFNKRVAKRKNMNLIAASRFSATMWEKDLGLPRGTVKVDYPFADAAFRSVRRPKYHGRKRRILFSGRLHPDKGIYTLLATLHIIKKTGLSFEVTATTAGGHSDDGQLVKTILDAHPWVKVIPAGRTPQEVAAIMANQDIVVMPSTNLFWKELFGMVSVEAQHAGCRVVASNGGGLPETDCGSLMLVEPDNPQSLAEGLIKAAKLGPLNDLERRRAANVFTVEESVEVLLDIIGHGAKASNPGRVPVRIPRLANRPSTTRLLQSDYLSETL
jgi:D-inositol-3-phosphate glycosyltransferase